MLSDVAFGDELHAGRVIIDPPIDPDLIEVGDVRRRRDIDRTVAALGPCGLRIERPGSSFRSRGDP
jgi:hypothetical protein